MTRITTTGIATATGLATGIDLQGTVDLLLAQSARPREQLAARTNGIRGEKAAIDTLSGLVLGLMSAATTLRLPTTYTGRSAAASDDNLSVAVSGTPSIGSQRLTPLALASSHQFVSNRFDGPDDLASAGTLTVGFGGQVDRGVSLGDLNGGAGVSAGKIRLTDRSGASETIDLRAASTIDDVLAAINAAEQIDVTASTSGGAIVLEDGSGGSGSLRVREVGAGTTAADLGLAGVSAAGETLTGDDVLTLGRATRLASIRDGSGVRVTDDLDEVADIVVTLAESDQEYGVDLGGAATLGDVVDAINDDADLAGKVRASIGADGLVLEDLTTGAETFAVSNGAVGTVADELGLTADASGGVVTGGRLLSGLRDTLVSSLRGGAGLTLGSIEITTSAGGPVTVDLSGEATLGGVVDRINADLGGAVVARVNDARDGIVLADNTGAASPSLVVANGSTGETAGDLGIATQTAVASIDGGSLDRQVTSVATRLETLRGGLGVSLGDFRITDAAGVSTLVSLDTPGAEAETLGDVIDRINAATGASVTAGLNATGDGLLLTDSSGGSGTLSVSEVNDGTTAADLRLTGVAITTDEDGQQLLDGSTRLRVDLAALETDARSLSLDDLRAGAGIDAGVFNVIAADNSNFAVDLGSGGGATTVGDVIDRINAAAAASGVAVSAAVNDEGTGLVLTDATGGPAELEVEDLGSGTAAADLNLIRTDADADGTLIDGAGLFRESDADGALAELAERINDFDAGVTASVLRDLGGFRLALTADASGSASQLVVSSGSSTLGFVETSRPSDAAAALGEGDFVVRSDTNRLEGVAEGLDITLNQASGTPTTVTVSADTTPTVDAVRGFVNAYNAIADNLDATTDFDPEALTTGVLFGTSEALRVETDLARIVSGRFVTSAGAATLESAGVSVGGDGRLSLDVNRLEAALADDPAAIESLFGDEEGGVAARLNEAADRLAGDANSLLVSRSDVLDLTITGNEERLTRLDERLELERERLLLDFIRMEETVALLQSNVDAISSIQPIEPIRRSSSRTN